MPLAGRTHARAPVVGPEALSLRDGAFASAGTRFPAHTRILISDHRDRGAVAKRTNEGRRSGDNGTQRSACCMCGSCACACACECACTMPRNRLAAPVPGHRSRRRSRPSLTPYHPEDPRSRATATSLATFSCACFRAGVSPLKFLVAKNGLYKKLRTRSFWWPKMAEAKTAVRKGVKPFLLTCFAATRSQGPTVEINTKASERI